MGKMPAEDYLDKLLNSVNDEKARKELEVEWNNCPPQKYY